MLTAMFDVGTGLAAKPDSLCVHYITSVNSDTRHTKYTFGDIALDVSHLMSHNAFIKLSKYQ